MRRIPATVEILIVGVLLGLGLYLLDNGSYYCGREVYALASAHAEARDAAP